MEPKNERFDAEEPGSTSSDNAEGDDEAGIDLPPAPELPQPPIVNYTRPPLKRGQYASRPDEHIGVSNAQDKINTAARMGSGLSAGITFASSVIVSAVIGVWVDRRFEPHSATPWATIVLSILGFVAGFITFLRITTIADENIKRRDK